MADYLTIAKSIPKDAGHRLVGAAFELAGLFSDQEFAGNLELVRAFSSEPARTYVTDTISKPRHLPLVVWLDELARLNPENTWETTDLTILGSLICDLHDAEKLNG